MIADRVKDTSTSTGTGNFVLSGSAPAGFQALAAIGAVGSTFGYVIDNGAEWEVGIGTITATNTFSRAPSASSNGGTLVSFSAGTKSVYHSITAAQHSRYMGANVAAFSATIPLTTPGNTYMPQQNVASVLGFTVGANPVQGALVYLRLVADGTNAPTFTGFKEWGGSLGYDNRAGIVNQVQFFYDGFDYWYSISQAVGAVAVDTVSPTQSSALVANSAPTYVDITMSEAMDPAYTPAASAITVSGHTVSSVSWASSAVLRAVVSAAFVNGEAARTAAYTAPGTNFARDLAGNALATFSGLAIANNVGAAATGATLSGPSGGAVSAASTAITLAITPVGSNVSGTVRYTFNDTSGGGSFNPAYLDLSNGTPSGTTIYTPNATAGAKAITTTNNGGLSNPSLTYTTTASSLRLSPVGSHLVESGTGPYTYTGQGFNFDITTGGLLTKSFQSAVDGSAAATMGAYSAGGSPTSAVLAGITTAASVQDYSTMQFAIYADTIATRYSVLEGGASRTASNVVAPAVGDIIRMRRTGSTLVGEVARAASPTVFTAIYTWTGVPTGALYAQFHASGAATISNLTAVGLA